ncbi:MAG: non-homologous end-joining DNA ligase [Acidimicrobiia bacterium]|nr:non-homologous end-joining DNA ligase [Acidimicrobiia bacterium]
MPEREAPRVSVTVGDRSLSLSNLDKVMYPEIGFTKAQVIDYYARIAPVMLGHVSGRCMTLRRWPDGVDGPSFFNKRCPSHRPQWVDVAIGPGDREGDIEYCRIDEPASLVWTANLAAIELHAPMAKADDLEAPTIMVFDLDPGPPAAIVECCQVALELREVLAAVDLQAFPKTSGSKGLQVYVPLNSPHTHEHASSFALAAGQLLARQHPERVLVEMNKNLRAGKVFVDWSQNSRHKTTIAAYSLRARPRPTVSAPISWDEVADGARGEPLSFESDEVLARVEALGDLFAPVEELVQHLPGLG